MTTPSPLPLALTLDEAVELLQRWHKDRAELWVVHQRDEGKLPFDGDPPRCSGEALWRLLLSEECDKLYNQAWCALDQIRDAEDPDDALMLAIDDLPSAVEQAWSLDPDLGAEHLRLLGEHKPGRVPRFLTEMAAGTPREAAERAECLAFWEENAELTSDFRRRLYREVRKALENP